MVSNRGHHNNIWRGCTVIIYFVYDFYHQILMPCVSFLCSPNGLLCILILWLEVLHFGIHKNQLKTLYIIWRACENTGFWASPLEFLPQWIWNEAWEFIFLTTSQVMLIIMLLVQRLLFENHCWWSSRSRGSPGNKGNAIAP